MANRLLASSRLILLGLLSAWLAEISYANFLPVADKTAHLHNLIIVSPTGPAVNLSPLVTILEDTSKKLEITQVSSSNHSADFRYLGTDLLILKNPASVYWLKLAIFLESNGDRPQQKIIYFPIRNWYVSKVTYFEPDGDSGYRIATAGRATPFSAKDVITQSIAFNLTLTPKQLTTVYLRIDQSGNGVATPLSMELLSPLQFAQKDNIKDALSMAFYGIILAFFVYNLLLFIALREPLYGYYLVFLAANITAIVIADGLVDRFIWPTDTAQIMTLYVTAVCLYYISYLKFISHTLNLEAAMPKAAKLFFGIYLLLAVIITMHLLLGDVPIVAKARLMCGVLALITAAAVTIKAALEKQRLAIYLLIAESIFITTYITGLLIGMAAIPLPGSYIPLTNYFGAAAETILLSLVIAEKMRLASLDIFESEKRVLRAQALQQTAESNKLLAENRARQVETDKERELIQAQQAVIGAQKSSLQLKSDFISSISHELRTPMNGIMGGLQLVQLSASPESQEPLDIIQSSADEMMALVDDILIHTEIQSARIDVSNDRIDTLLLLDKLHRDYQKLCHQKNLKLEWRVNPNMEKWLVSDHKKLSTILSKLLDNAVKFTNKGVIKFSISCQKSSLPWQLMASIKDSGTGIEQHDQSQIFNSFVQGESGFGRRYGGLGIGLSICQKLTNALGGSLQLDSSSTSGSVFSIKLPVKQASPEIEKTASQRSTQHLPILIVEDNIVNQKIIQKLLEKLGFISLIANQGVEALDILEHQAVALILMDLQMPLMDGFTCSKAVRKRDDSINNIPIIALTANVMDVDKKRCLENGMNDFLMKPVSLGLLSTTLAKYI